MRRVSLVLACIFLLMMGLQPSTETTGIIVTKEASIKETMNPAYETHDPISITSDSAFATQASSEGWSGDGSEGSPYIIEGYEIIGSTKCIFINGVSSYFIIRNCRLLSDGGHQVEGINIYSGTDHCTIENNIITGFSWHGMIIGYSDNCSIFNNTISRCVEGISLFDSVDCNLTDNSFIDCSISIGGGITSFRHHMSGNTVNGKPLGYFWNASSTLIDGSPYGQVILGNCSNVTVENGFFYNSTNGITLGHCTDCVVDSLNIQGTLYAGLLFYYSTNCTVSSSTFYPGDEEAIWFRGSNLCNVVDCVIDCTQDIDRAYGVYLTDSTNCTIHNNTIRGEWHGFRAYSSLDCNITENIFEGCGIDFGGNTIENLQHTFVDNTINGKFFGYFWNLEDTLIDGTPYGQIFIGNSTRVTIQNGIFGNAGSEVKLVFSSFCTIKDATIYGGYTGVYLKNSPHCILSNLVIHDIPNQGIYVATDSENCTIEQCTIYTTYSTGITLYSSNCTARNNNVTDTTWGFALVSADNATITDNTISEGYEGIDLDGSTNCRLIGNIISDTRREGIKLEDSDNCNITGNIITNSGWEGISIASSQLSVIHNNSIRFSYEHGLLLSDVTVSTLTLNEVLDGEETGIFLSGGCSGNTLYDNLIGWNSGGNARDDGSSNVWDNGADLGNRWSDYTPPGTYAISGSAGSVDRYPQKADTTAPTISSPINFEKESGEIGHWINWTVFDERPDYYSITENGTVIESGPWNGDDISFSVDANLNVGLYIYTLTVDDSSGNSDSDTVQVTVIDTTNPIVDNPVDIEFSAGQTGVILTWSPSDPNPSSYEIYMNASLIKSGLWNTSSETISFILDGLNPGTYNYRLVVFDSVGNSVEDVVIVTVLQTTVTTTTTTSDQEPGPFDPLTVVLVGAGIGIAVLLVIILVILPRRRIGRPGVSIPPDDMIPPTAGVTETGVQILRGCEVVGGKFDFKVKIKNISGYVITNVEANILAYPDDCLEIDGPRSKRIKRIEPDGFRSPQFTFKPTKDCVEGRILATVSFVDHEDNPHSIEAEPYTIRSVCDLLIPLETSVEEFELMIGEMEVASETASVEFNPKVLTEKVVTYLPMRNFHIIESQSEVIDGEFRATVRGLAEGKYTRKKIAVRISIIGKEDGTVSEVIVDGIGEDVSMLPTTIREISEGIMSWTCIHCGASFEPEDVTQLKEGRPIKCKYCNKTVTLEQYSKST